MRLLVASVVTLTLLMPSLGAAQGLDDARQSTASAPPALRPRLRALISHEVARLIQDAPAAGPAAQELPQPEKTRHVGLGAGLGLLSVSAFGFATCPGSSESDDCRRIITFVWLPIGVATGAVLGYFF